MCSFRGVIGRFRIHSARILPGRRPFRVEAPGITHGAKILPALSAAWSSPFQRAGQELALQAPDFPPSLRPSCLMASLAMDTEMRTLLSSSMVAWRLTAPLASMATWRLTAPLASMATWRLTGPLSSMVTWPLTTPLFSCEKESLPFFGTS